MDYRKRYGLIQSDTLGQLYHTAADYQMFIMWKPGGRNDASPYVSSSYENQHTRDENRKSLYTKGLGKFDPRRRAS
jgi:hypothetical protein